MEQELDTHDITTEIETQVHVLFYYVLPLIQDSFTAPTSIASQSRTHSPPKKQLFKMVNVTKDNFLEVRRMVVNSSAQNGGVILHNMVDITCL